MGKSDDTLAIDGGTPVRGSMLPYGRQTLDDADRDAVSDVLRSDWLTTGPAVEAFETALAASADTRHAVAVSSGTAALHTAMHAIGIGAGDEVIVPAITFAATANAVLYCGGTPLFADVDPDSLLIDPTSAESLITNRTRAIVAMDYGGQPAAYEALRLIAEEHGISLVSDASHSLGARVNGSPAAALADVSTFSFHPIKSITTGEGGAIVTDTESIDARARTFRNHGIDRGFKSRDAAADWVYDQCDLGFNYRLADINCALGLSQLTHLESLIEKRQALADRYAAAIGDLPGIKPLDICPGIESAWHLYAVRLDLSYFSADRAAIFRALRAENIGVNVHYLPVYWHSYYTRLGYAKGLCPQAEAAYQSLLTLPMWAGMSASDVDDVILALQKIVYAYGLES